MSTTTTTTPPPLPILLLKSPSPFPPTDPYALTHPPNAHPTFIPVLTHTLLPDALIQLLLTHFSPGPKTTPFPYGALIFTSQRSVAAFSAALTAPQVLAIKEFVQRGFERVRVYVVGPATERAVRGVWGGLFKDRVFGEGAGRGEGLGGLMLGDWGGEGDGARGAYYGIREEASGAKKPVLFLTGEKRRDVIPRMLMDPKLSEGERVRVDELEVYKTGQLEEFEFLFAKEVARVGREGGPMWVVVFSPTAGEGMLRGLGWLDEGSGRVRDCVVRDKGRETFVACIGPTTRDYLVREFGFEPDVVAKKPSPLGVKEGIEGFMRGRGL